MGWKDVKGYEGMYQINESGNVKRLSHIRKHKGTKGVGKGNGHRVLTEKILKQSINSSGYLAISLNNKHYYIHRLLAENFIPNPENKITVNHKDGNKLNNDLSNLEWASYKENNDHAKLLGLNREVGETHHNSKLTNVDVQNIKFMIYLGYKNKDLAQEYNVCSSTIGHIKRGSYWSHINI